MSTPYITQKLIKYLAMLIGLILLANIMLYCIGFGQAPLVLLDKDIEYYLKPKMAYKRFGNDIIINRYGMRSVDFDRRKQQPFYALIGDSVVYGEHTVDQTNTMAYLLNNRLLQEFQDESIIVGSIAASSWGPENMLSFYKKFGPFSGKIAFVILSSHDRSDVPFMTRRLTPYRLKEPASALFDFIQSIAERIEDRVRGDVRKISFKKRLSLSESSLNSLLNLLKSDYDEVILVFHATRKEVLVGSSTGESYYRDIADQHNIEFFSTMVFYKELYSNGVAPHSDNIHLTAQGNRNMAEKLVELVN